MSEFQSIISKMGESNGSKKEEKPANIKAADEVSENVFDHTLTKEEEKTAGPAVHYAMGAASGLIYGITSEITPVSTLGVGLPFGAAVWLVADEIVVPALGLSKPATEYPVSKHAYALGSHLVYGVTTDLVRRGLMKVM